MGFDRAFFFFGRFVIFGPLRYSRRMEQEEKEQGTAIVTEKSMIPSREAIHAVRDALGLLDTRWAELCSEIALVVDRSNQAYGNSTERSARLMAILWPDGVSPDRMHDARCMISILDKLSRIVTDRDAFGESPWRDVAGYALLAYRHDLEEKPGRSR
jgi:hypothetical protein